MTSASTSRSAPTHDLLVFIGRFQIFHEGHLKVVSQALQKSRELLLLIGSADQPRSSRNPFSFDERKEMVLRCLTPEERGRVFFAKLHDYAHSDSLWIRRVQEVVSYHCERLGEPKVGLIGHNKDNSSFYLKLFPHWDSLHVDNYHDISSTQRRDQYFMEQEVTDVPQAVQEFLEEFKVKDGFEEMKAEYEFIKKYKKGWENAPYSPIFVTVDAVCIQSGHILLVERQALPGKGLWALPGGFIQQDEKLIDGVIRKLREETRLKIPVPVIYGANKGSKVFDDPHRSDRGRTITHAFLFTLRDDTSLPKVRGGNDSKKAFWVKFSDVKREKMYEDHYYVIQSMLNDV